MIPFNIIHRYARLKRSKDVFFKLSLTIGNFVMTFIRITFSYNYLRATVLTLLIHTSHILSLCSNHFKSNNSFNYTFFYGYFNFFFSFIKKKRYNAVENKITRFLMLLHGRRSIYHVISRHKPSLTSCLAY